jgi:hypothetical protein
VAAQRFTVDDLPALARHWDAAVERTPDVDAFCSATPWSFSAATSFPDVAPPVLVGDGTGFCGLREVRGPEGTRVLVGLDPVWGFASPAVGAPHAAARMLAARLDLDGFDHALVSGQRPDSVLTAWIVRILGERHRLLHGPAQERLVIDLTAGFEGWLAGRSPRFRQRARHLLRSDDGLSFSDVSAMPPDDLFDRILDVESRSWKAGEGTGLNAPELAAFYRQVAARLAGRDQLRVLLAHRDERDVGYILGGVRGDRYRGLQLAYVEEVRALSVGHRLQLEQLRRLGIEGIRTYDLGMDMEYKRRWADTVEETFSIIVVGG